MTVFITGGAGFIGSHLVEEMSKTKEKIIIFDDFSAGKHNLPFLKDLSNVSIIKGSITDYNSVKQSISQCSEIVHLAAMNRAPLSIENPILANEVNVNGTLNILEAARKYDIQKIVFASSSSVYGRSPKYPRREIDKPHPAHPYAVGKLASELYCDVYHHLYGLQIAVLRYFAVYGPRQSSTIRYAAVIPIFVNCIIQGNPLPIYGDGTQRRNFTFVEDTVKVTIAAINSDSATGKVINISSPIEVSLNQIIDILEQISGKKGKKMFKNWRKGDVKQAPPDLSLAEKVIGDMPRTSIREGIEKTYNWYLNFPNYFSR
jgi:UDP-glucose 4-epimerase